MLLFVFSAIIFIGFESLFLIGARRLGVEL